MIDDAIGAEGDQALLELFEDLSLAAGRAIMDVRAAGAKAEIKPDRSPVTEADRLAERIILEGLRAACPSLACVAEEEASAGRLPVVGDAPFLLIDPLDGTREFVAGSRDFTVNIALVRAGAPVVGAVYAPARHELYSGGAGTAWRYTTSASHEKQSRSTIRARGPRVPPTILTSLSHRTPETDSYVACFADATVIAIGSSYKFCLLAAGEADLYPRFGPTMQWDTAAGDAILRAAGGMTTGPDGGPLSYGARRRDGATPFLNPDFVARGAS